MTNPFYHSSTPLVPGTLHSPSKELDSSGMGAIAHLHGKLMFSVLDHALNSVSCMIHLGAVDADMKTSDGSGIPTQIPFPLFTKTATRKLVRVIAKVRAKLQAASTPK